MSCLEDKMIYNEDCLVTIDRLEDSSINLVVTSPPYTDMKSYGKVVKNRIDDKYIDWLIKIFDNLYNKVDDSGSLIVNIDDAVKNGFRGMNSITLILEMSKRTNWKFYDLYIWNKKNNIPNCSNRRLNHNYEFIIHFTKNNQFKANCDRIRIPHNQSSIDRFRYTVMPQYKKTNNDGIVIKMKSSERKEVNPLGRIPNSVISFKNASNLRESPSNEHPAPYHWELPEFFIKWLTDEGDTVYDPFMGSGSTAYASNKNRRECIGSEINKNYVPLIEEWIEISNDNMNNLSELFGG
jgi:DNA modification methylase